MRRLQKVPHAGLEKLAAENIAIINPEEMSAAHLLRVYEVSTFLQPASEITHTRPKSPPDAPTVMNAIFLGFSFIFYTSFIITIYFHKDFFVAF